MGHPLLEGVDYSDVLQEPGAMEMAYVVFTNNLELDENGAPLNARHCEIRAAQWLRKYCDPGYTAQPPFAEYECEEHWPAVLTNAPGRGSEFRLERHPARLQKLAHKDDASKQMDRDEARFR